MRRVFVFLASLGVVGIVAACGGKVVVDTTGSGGAGGAGGASTTSPSASTSTSASTTGTVGFTAGSAGVGGNGSTTNCETCNQFLSSGPNGQGLCGASQGLFDSLRSCACSSGTCLTQCGASLCENTGASQDCASCLSTSCPSQNEMCLGD